MNGRNSFLFRPSLYKSSGCLLDVIIIKVPLPINIEIVNTLSSSEQKKGEIYHKIIHHLPNQKWMNISINIENNLPTSIASVISVI